MSNIPEKGSKQWIKMYNAYKQQKKFTEWSDRLDAQGNIIRFDISFNDWCQVWITSGKWDLRGNKTGCYVMARYNDTGPYHKDNVKIILHTDNISEAHLGREHTKETKLKLSVASKGKKKPPRSKEHCANLSKPKSELTRQRMSQARKGKTMSEESRQKLSEIHKKSGLKPNIPPVSCVRCQRLLKTNMLKNHYNACNKKEMINV